MQLASSVCSHYSKLAKLDTTGLLFQEELDRSQRLRKAQQEFEIDDDMIGGQQGNSLLELIKQGKLHAKKAPPGKKENKTAASSRPVSAGPTTEVCHKDLVKHFAETHSATHMQNKQH